MDLTALDLGDASRLLGEGQVPAVELTRAYLERIAALDPGLNCYVTVTAEAALAAAAASDRRRARGERLGPLDGVPLALKDNIARRSQAWPACPP